MTSEKGKVKPLKIINIISAIFITGLFMALLYTVPKAIATVSAADIKFAVLNVFFLVWFAFLAKATYTEEKEQ